jgi:hypothetical protein
MTAPFSYGNFGAGAPPWQNQRPPWQQMFPIQQPGTASQGGGGFLSGVSEYIKKNPELISSILGTAANVYGGIRADKRAGEALDLQKQAEKAREEEAKRAAEEARLRTILQAMGTRMGGY